MLFNILSPVLPIQPIDADTFSEAAKKFVEMKKNLDITRLILSDRFKNTMRADIAYNIRDNDLVAGISLRPSIYPSMPYNVNPHVVNPHVVNPYGLGSNLVGAVSHVNSLGLPVQPVGLVRNTSDGQQVFPVNKNNIAVGGVNMGLGFSPTMAHGFPYGTLNKNLKN